MGSLWGFRCKRCRAEVLARPESGPLMDRRAWTPPVLCCGQALRALEPDQVVLVMPSRRRAARCPRCGYQVRLVVHPAGPLVCMVCQTNFVILEGTPDRTGRTTAAVTPTADAW
jgi:DNA-directed RNA polymerase subunit RPC12/RpoP